MSIDLDDGQDETLDERVQRLEDIAFEGDGLRRSVDRLGLNANALGEALRTIDRNQQRMTQLGREVEEVQNNAATKKQLAAATAKHQAELRKYRQTVLGRAYAGGIALAGLLAVISLAAVNYVEAQKRADYRQCLASVDTRDSITEFLSAVRDNSIVPAIRQSADEVLGDFRPVDCERFR